MNLFKKNTKVTTIGDLIAPIHEMTKKEFNDKWPTKPKRVNRLYTEGDDKLIRAYYKAGHTDHAIAQYLCRNPDAIAKRRSVLSCVKYKRPKQEVKMTNIGEPIRVKFTGDGHSTTFKFPEISTDLEITRQTLAALGYELTLTKVKK